MKFRYYDGTAWKQITVHNPIQFILNHTQADTWQWIRTAFFQPWENREAIKELVKMLKDYDKERKAREIMFGIKTPERDLQRIKAAKKYVQSRVKHWK